MSNSHNDRLQSIKLRIFLIGDSYVKNLSFTKRLTKLVEWCLINEIKKTCLSGILWQILLRPIITLTGKNMAEFVEIRLIVPGFLGLELGNLLTRKIMTEYLESLRNFHQTITLSRS